MSDLKDILAKLDKIAEGEITPVNVKSGLNKQQRKVPELPALFKPKSINVLTNKTDPEHPTKGYFVGAESVEQDEDQETISEVVTSEDVVSTVKKKLGDYLADLSKEIKSDSDLKDKIPQDVDHIGPSVRTINTDDGHEIKIHGNEDDGFRITIKNKPHSAKFESLKHAEMACEMYCSHRRAKTMEAPQATPDYLDEA
jgi:hypothetical protein